MFGIIKDKFLINKETGISEMVTSVVHLEGSEQLSIQVVSGFGASEKRERILISEHDVEDFKNKYLDKKFVNVKIMEDVKKESSKDNFTEMRSMLFDAVRGLKDGTMKVDQAKAIASVSQTIINSVKLEVEALKMGVKSVKSLD